MRDENCIFCKIANGEIPSSTVYEDEDFRVILDLGPASRGHALILPKEHFADICELPDAWAAKVLPLGVQYRRNRAEVRKHCGICDNSERKPGIGSKYFIKREEAICRIRSI